MPDSQQAVRHCFLRLRQLVQILGVAGQAVLQKPVGFRAVHGLQRSALLRECGVDEVTIEQIRIADRADFNSNRRFYRWTNDVAEYLEDMADRERQAEVNTVAELLDEIESENLYQVLVTVDGRTLKIVLLKMQGYSTKEIAPLVHLTTGAIYARLDHLRKKLRKIL